MAELEVKVLGIDGARVRSRLEHYGARKVFDGIMAAHYFDDANESLRERGITLRIRQEGDISVLAVKGPQDTDSKVKSLEEFETVVGSPEQLMLGLEALGYARVGGVTKQRESYIVEPAAHNLKFKVEIDKFLGEDSYVPEFVEIEAGSEADVFRGATLLGFAPERCLTWNGKQVKDFYRGYSQD